MTTYEQANLFLQTITWMAIIGTLWVYNRQLRTMKKQLDAMKLSSDAQNIIAIINLLQSSEIRDARSYVIKELKGKKYEVWKSDEKSREIASRVCSSYDIVSILVYQQKIVTNLAFLENWYPSIKNCYEILAEFIADMQQSANSGPSYWNDFEVLYNEAVKHLPKN